MMWFICPARVLVMIKNIYLLLVIIKKKLSVGLTNIYVVIRDTISILFASLKLNPYVAMGGGNFAPRPIFTLLLLLMRKRLK